MRCRSVRIRFFPFSLFLVRGFTAEKPVFLFCGVRAVKFGSQTSEPTACKPCRALPRLIIFLPSFSACEDMAFTILQFSYGVVKATSFIFTFLLLSACTRRKACPSQAYTLPKCPSRVRATPTTPTRAKLGSRFPPPHAKAFFVGACSDFVHHRALAL